MPTTISIEPKVVDLLVRQFANKIVAGDPKDVCSIAFRMWLSENHPGTSVDNPGAVLVEVAEAEWKTVTDLVNAIVGEYGDRATEAIKLAASVVSAR